MADGEKIRVMELSRSDVVEMLSALRARADGFGKLSKALRKYGCHSEADTLDSRISDIRERLCTQLAAELGPGGDGQKEKPKA